MNVLRFLLFCFFAFPIYSMQSKWSKYDNNTMYLQGVKLIDESMKVKESRFNKLLEEKANAMGANFGEYCIFQLRLQMYKNICQNCLKDIEDALKEKEEDLLREICEEFGKSAEVATMRNTIQQKTEEKFTAYLTNFDVTYPQVTAFPESTISYFKAIGINLLSIEIKNNDIPSNIPGVSCFAGSRFEGKPVIKLGGTFYDKDHIQLATLEHELAHLLLMHPCKEMAISDAISWDVTQRSERGTPIVSITNGRKIKDSKYYNEFKILLESQADLLYKSPQGLAAVRMYRSKHFYPEHLYASHYAQIAKIHEIHKRLDLIEKLQRHLSPPTDLKGRSSIERE